MWRGKKLGLLLLLPQPLLTVDEWLTEWMNERLSDGCVFRFVSFYFCWWYCHHQKVADFICLQLLHTSPAHTPTNEPTKRQCCNSQVFPRHNSWNEIFAKIKCRTNFLILKIANNCSFKYLNSWNLLQATSSGHTGPTHRHTWPAVSGKHRESV